MFPWGHLAVAYLAYAGYTHWAAGEPPSGWTPIVLAVAALGPDLLDKPLAWSLALLPSGRSLAHSLLLLVPVFGGMVWLASQRERSRLGAVVAIGWLSHPVADALGTVFAEGAVLPNFLLWPLLAVEAADDTGYLIYFLTIEPTPFVVFEAVVTVVAVGLWVYHGLPGLDWLRIEVGSRLRSIGG